MDYQEMMMANNVPNIPQLESSASNGLGSILGTISANSAKNTAQSQAFAREQMAFQVAQNAKAMEFNAQQAALNREWQKMMSDTAHQREVADLRAAGLNPILSAMGGNGASVGSGATASGSTSAGSKGDVDSSVNATLASVLGAMLNTQTQLEMANINAKTQEAVADKYTSMSYLLETMQENFKIKYPQNWWTALENIIYHLFPGAEDPGDVVEQAGSTVSGKKGAVKSYIDKKLDEIHQTQRERANQYLNAETDNQKQYLEDYSQYRKDSVPKVTKYFQKRLYR